MGREPITPVLVIYYSTKKMIAPGTHGGYGPHEKTKTDEKVDEAILWR